jgi:uncharacterized protein
VSAKLLLILGIILGVLALALLAPSLPTPPPSAPVASGEWVDSGHFVLERNGTRWLDESFTLFLVTDGSYMLVSQSTLTVSGTAIAIAEQTRYDAQFRPLEYQLAAEAPSGPQIVSAQRSGRAFTMEVRAGAARQAADGVWDDDLVLLDNNVIAHFAVLLKALRAGEVGQTLSAAVPQALARIPSRWEEAVPVRFTSGERTYDGRATSLHLGDTAIDLVSYDGRLVGLVNRTQGTVAYDIDLLPDGFSIERPSVQTSSSAVVEREVTFPSGDVRLVGTLMLPPAQTPPMCAVLFVAGSGPVDRNGNAPGLEMDAYRQLAQSLALDGIASLRYDKRGVGQSAGDSRVASRSDLLSDVRAAWSVMRAEPEISGLPCVALGHSEGTYLVEGLAAGNPDVGGLILLCGSQRSLADVTRWQVETFLRRQGATEEQVQAALEQEDEYIAFVKGSKGQWTDIPTADLQAALPWLGQAGAEQLRASALGLAWLREHYNADPAQDLARITCPVLILSGGKDAQVPPADGQAMADILTAAGNRAVTAVLLDDLNHVLRHHPEEPNVVYQHLDEPVDPRLPAAIGAWAKRDFGG